MCTTKFNVSPSFTIELLERLAKVRSRVRLDGRAIASFVGVGRPQVFKDYCGVLTEESIRKNFILVYELLDEMLVRALARLRGGIAAFVVGDAAAVRRWRSRVGAGLRYSAGHIHGDAQNVSSRMRGHGACVDPCTCVRFRYVHNEPIVVDAARVGGGFKVLRRLRAVRVRRRAEGAATAGHVVKDDALVISTQAHRDGRPQGALCGVLHVTPVRLGRGAGQEERDFRRYFGAPDRPV